MYSAEIHVLSHKREISEETFPRLRELFAQTIAEMISDHFGSAFQGHVSFIDAVGDLVWFEKSFEVMEFATATEASEDDGVLLNEKPVYVSIWKEG